MSAANTRRSGEFCGSNRRQAEMDAHGFSGMVASSVGRITRNVPLRSERVGASVAAPPCLNVDEASTRWQESGNRPAVQVTWPLWQHTLQWLRTDIAATEHQLQEKTALLHQLEALAPNTAPLQEAHTMLTGSPGEDPAAVTRASPASASSMNVLWRFLSAFLHSSIVASPPPAPVVQKSKLLCTQCRLRQCFHRTRIHISSASPCPCCVRSAGAQM